MCFSRNVEFLCEIYWYTNILSNSNKLITFLYLLREIDLVKTSHFITIWSFMNLQQENIYFVQCTWIILSQCKHSAKSGSIRQRPMRQYPVSNGYMFIWRKLLKSFHHIVELFFIYSCHIQVLQENPEMLKYSFRTLWRFSLIIYSKLEN